MGPRKLLIGKLSTAFMGKGIRVEIADRYYNKIVGDRLAKVSLQAQQ